ncbi:BEN domain-containing protein 5 [Liparis tanakae]|uniref:BEN domain-containing protein 5 n=1 Tax=Liparis tanakae TaxID=230148 RepID=A0A4Z2IDA7_9TELE|nr:BEN domain-containing protein 5 [Liparis tanakae]
MRRLQQELERTRRQLVQQAKKLKEYGSLLTEVKELRDFNRRLQDVLLMRLGSEPMHDNGTQTIKAEVVEPIVEAQETCREEANTSSSYSPSPRTVYTCNDGKVRLTGSEGLSLYYQPQQHVAYCCRTRVNMCVTMATCGPADTYCASNYHRRGSAYFAIASQACPLQVCS